LRVDAHLIWHSASTGTAVVFWRDLTDTPERQQSDKSFRFAVDGPLPRHHLKSRVRASFTMEAIVLHYQFVNSRSAAS
jgi:hypothetical protein